MKAPCDATTGGGRDFCEPREEYGFVRAIFCRSVEGREGGPESEKFATMDRSSYTSDSALVSESIVKEASGLRYYFAYSIFFEAPLVTRSVP